MNPARRVYRELKNGSHPNVSTCNTAQRAGAEDCSAPDDETVAEAGSKSGREACGKGFIAVRTGATGSVSLVPVRMGRDCG
jgi:hypothetical protein